MGHAGNIENGAQSKSAGENGAQSRQSAGQIVAEDEGRDEREVKDYIQKYTLQPEYMLDHVIKNLKSSSLKRVYAFTYYHGKKIVQNYLEQSEDKLLALNYLMKNQIYPSLIK